jgi:hypothetical protein
MLKGEWHLSDAISSNSTKTSMHHLESILNVICIHFIKSAIILDRQEWMSAKRKVDWLRISEADRGILAPKSTDVEGINNFLLDEDCLLRMLLSMIWNLQSNLFQTKSSSHFRVIHSCLNLLSDFRSGRLPDWHALWWTSLSTKWRIIEMPNEFRFAFPNSLGSNRQNFNLIIHEGPNYPFSGSAGV